MKNYYQLWGKLGHAYSNYIHSYFYGLSQDQGWLESWPDITWTWKPSIGPETTPVPDYPRAAEGCALYSGRMREIVDAHLGPADEVQWIPSTMRHGDNREEKYWILHFPHAPDVLNMEMSTWGENGVPMRWGLQEDKLVGHDFFPACRNNIIASDRLVKAFRAAGITGINPKRVRMDC
jgi:hypothetical protein